MFIKIILEEETFVLLVELTFIYLYIFALDQRFHREKSTFFLFLSSFISKRIIGGIIKEQVS